MVVGLVAVAHARELRVVHPRRCGAPADPGQRLRDRDGLGHRDALREGRPALHEVVVGVPDPARHGVVELVEVQRGRLLCLECEAAVWARVSRLEPFGDAVVVETVPAVAGNHCNCLAFLDGIKAYCTVGQILVCAHDASLNKC